MGPEPDEAQRFSTVKRFAVCRVQPGKKLSSVYLTIQHGGSSSAVTDSP